MTAGISWEFLTSVVTVAATASSIAGTVAVTDEIDVAGYAMMGTTPELDLILRYCRGPSRR